MPPSANQQLTCEDPINKPPEELCDKLIELCIELCDMLNGKQEATGATQRKEKMNFSEICTTANELSATEFMEGYDGKNNVPLQHMCCETKLIDAVFEAAIAPYNRTGNRVTETTPFKPGTRSGVRPRAVEKFLFVVLWRMIDDNLKAISYFGKRVSREWRYADQLKKEKFLRDFPKVRGDQRWLETLVHMGDHGYGATVLLSEIFSASSGIMEELVNDGMLEDMKRRITECGPQPRFVKFFSSICFVEGRPQRKVQRKQNPLRLASQLFLLPYDRSSLRLSNTNQTFISTFSPALGTYQSND